MSRIAELLSRKRLDVERRKASRTPVVPSDDRRVTWDKNRFRIIAEIKRASISAGSIRTELDPIELALSYEKAGAAAISVLTEEHYFQGSLDDLRHVRAATSIPVLQKDFILDEFQILEAKEAGADFVLLIARFLTSGQMREMVKLCDEIRINALVEVTDEADLEKIDFPVRYLGVNCRDLETLEVDLSRFERMQNRLPEAFCIAESGIRNVDDLRRVMELGYNGALIGESLLRSEDPSHALRTLVAAATSNSSTLSRGRLEGGWYPTKVKICGITNERDARLAVEAGASALGFVFAESPRKITSSTLQLFRSQIPVPCVGVFRGNVPDEIRSIIGKCSLDIAQIYDQAAELSVPIWRAITIDSLDGLADRTEHLVDIKLPEKELPEAWKLLGETSVFALAGGLHQGNVQQAISLCHPEWVDVARGVESEPGIKDANKVREFIQNAHEYKRKVL